MLSSSKTSVDSKGRSVIAAGARHRSVPYARVQEAADRLTAATVRVDNGETQEVLDLYAARVVEYAQRDVAAARGFFLPRVCSFFLRVDCKRPMPVEARQLLADDMIARLEAATTIVSLVEAFQAAFQWLLDIDRSGEGPKILRLDAAVSRLRRDFASRQRLAVVARRAGFSVPAFVKLFRRRVGTSFVPFVRALRVAHATRILTETDKPLAEIASTSGFDSLARMNRAFRSVTGALPVSRRWARRLAPAAER
jgi:AraC-like DNA-binding protein